MYMLVLDKYTRTWTSTVHVSYMYRVHVCLLTAYTIVRACVQFTHWIN